MSDHGHATIDALAAVDAWDVPNVAAAVFDRGGLRAGHGDVDRSFDLASVSKVFGAVATLVAVEEGTVALDDSAGPDGSTLKHLLAHASGLAPEADGGVISGPGRRRIYSNQGFDVIAGHVATGSGMTFDEYASAALVEPLGLRSTDLSGSPAHGYHSSVRDVALLMTALVSGQLLAAETVTALTTPAFADLAGVLPGYGSQDPNPWGLGVEIRGTKAPHWTSPNNSLQTWGHFGRSGTFVWFDPAASVGLVALTDKDFGQWAMDAWPELSSSILASRG